MVDMKEQLLMIIEKSNVPRTSAELAEKTGLSGEALNDMLESLIQEGRVAVTRKGKYAVPEALGLVAARVSFQRNGTPQLCPLAGGAYVPLRYKGGVRCMPGDLVLARVEGAYGELVNLIHRGRDTFPAYVRLEKKIAQDRQGRQALESGSQDLGYCRALRSEGAL